jgi:hypothetical protein
LIFQEWVLEIEGPYGREDQSTDLGFESSVRPRVRMHDEATDIANHLTSTSEHYETAIAPGLVAEGENRIGEEEDSEVGTQEGIGAEVWIVAIDGEVNRAF